MVVRMCPYPPLLSRGSHGMDTHGAPPVSAAVFFPLTRRDSGEITSSVSSRIIESRFLGS